MAKSGAQDDLLSLNEKNFLLDALNAGRRVDGRGFYDYRTLRIVFGAAPGCVQIQLGQTKVVAVTSCEVVPPYQDRPTEGFFRFDIEFSPMASPAFESGRPTAQAIETIRVVERGLRESGAIDTEALCIVAGEKVWAVKVTINIIDDDGNIVDACGIAAITALHHFRRPDVSITAEGIVVHPIHERTPVPLSIHHMPIAVSFAAFEQGDTTVMLVDPSWKEEKIAAGKMTITLNAQNELCAIQKAGGVAMLPTDIIRATKIAATKVGEISQAVSAALKSAKFEALEPSFGIGLSQLEKDNIAFKRGSASVVMPSSEKSAPSSVDMSDFRDFAQRLQKEHDRKDSEAKEKAEQFLSSFKM